MQVHNEIRAFGDGRSLDIRDRYQRRSSGIGRAADNVSREPPEAEIATTKVRGSGRRQQVRRREFRDRVNPPRTQLSRDDARQRRSTNPSLRTTPDRRHRVLPPRNPQRQSATPETSRTSGFCSRSDKYKAGVHKHSLALRPMFMCRRSGAGDQGSRRLDGSRRNIPPAREVSMRIDELSAFLLDLERKEQRFVEQS